MRSATPVIAKGRHNSVHALSPRHPTLQILSGLPIRTHIHTHSVIGNRGRPGPLAESSDGIVPYWSSHLPQAESELVVPADHSAYQNPAAVAEIKRILRPPRTSLPRLFHRLPH